MHQLVVVIHVIAGTAGLLLGPVAMIIDSRRFAAGRRTTGPVTAGYAVIVGVVCLSGSGLVLLARPDLWWLIPVSVLTFGLTVLAVESARRRYHGWTHGYVHGMGGSFIAQVTALVVVAFAIDGPLRGGAELIAWLTPTAVGTILIEVWRRRLRFPLPSRS
ncbi:hypothetical protein [Microlunatus parietis]|uniref:DUF2306 domain-containing protein n=1 Tax=Microlunatus parietis TaxID=682979 RepID=A0A7Y9LE60_9ACTN|nr:hypothetical protein [Microlunatus parietis]NYE73498.1 hypothetical protein [Microlunatus parietis]